MEHNIVKENIFNVDVEMFEELLEPFLTACEDLYYGIAKATTIDGLKKRGMKEGAAKKLYASAFYFMAEDEQPNLGALAGLLKGEEPDEELESICSRYLEDGGSHIGTLVEMALRHEFKAKDHVFHGGYVDVLVEEKHSGWEFWISYWGDSCGDIDNEWAQDIFSRYDENDMIRSRLQDYSIFTLSADGAAFDYLRDKGIVSSRENGWDFHYDKQKEKA